MRTLVFVLLLLTVAGARAEPYVGVGVGSVAARGFCAGSSGGSCEERDQGWRLFGGWRDKVLSAEVGYANLGVAKARNGNAKATLKTDAMDVSGLARLQVSKEVSVHGRLGFYRATTRGDSNFGASAYAKSSGLTLGFGAEWCPLSFCVRADAQRWASVGDDATGKADIDMLSLGALWRF